MSVDPNDVVRRYVSSVGTPVTSGDVDTYERISQIQNREARERGERNLRLIYATALLALLVGQIIAVTTLAFLIGFGIINLDRWVATSFVAGTFGEVSGMAFLVVRYLFPVNGARF